MASILKLALPLAAFLCLPAAAHASDAACVGTQCYPTVTSPLRAPVSGQVKIASTGVAVCLPSRDLANGVALKARTTNAANMFAGPSGVTTTYDGTGNGFPLEPGAGASFAIQNAASLCVNGTSGDIASYEGN